MEMGYEDLVKWVGETKVFMRGRPEEPSVYTSLINVLISCLFCIGAPSEDDWFKSLLQAYWNVD